MTKPLQRRVLLVGVVVAMFCALSACSGSDPKPMNYVALGDSFVAGGGITTTSTVCLRSDHNYPALLAKELAGNSFVDRSCGGATNDSVMNGTVMSNGVTLPAQIDSVRADTDLVTIGIGGNDSAATARLFVSCLIPSSSSPQKCRSTLASISKQFVTTRRNIAHTLEKIKARAPHARVILVGYLRILPDFGTCPAIPVTAEELRLAAAAEADLDNTLRLAAADADVLFLPMRSPSVGHDACAGENAWVNGITAARGDGVFLHPRAAGMRAVAKAIHARVTAN